MCCRNGSTASRAFAAEPRGFLRGLEGEQRLWEPIGRLFETYDAIVCPTWAVTGIPAGDSILGTLFEGGGPNDRQYACMMTVPFNVLSPCPVLAVPSGFASNGVPTGLQIVGRPFADVDVFRIGSTVERVRPWPTVCLSVPLAVVLIARPSWLAPAPATRLRCESTSLPRA